jgi:hypothetical protein
MTDLIFLTHVTDGNSSDRDVLSIDLSQKPKIPLGPDPRTGGEEYRAHWPAAYEASNCCRPRRRCRLAILIYLK